MEPTIALSWKSTVIAIFYRKICLILHWLWLAQNSATEAFNYHGTMDMHQNMDMMCKEDHEGNENHRNGKESDHDNLQQMIQLLGDYTYISKKSRLLQVE